MEAAADRVERGVHELTSFKQAAVKAWQGSEGDLIDFAINQIRQGRCRSSMLRLDNTMLGKVCSMLVDSGQSTRQVSNYLHKELRNENIDFMISDSSLFRFAKRFRRVYYELKQAAF